jgi:hypothetical protein
MMRDRTRENCRFFSAILLVATLAMPELALASSAGAVIQTANKNIVFVPPLVSAICYVIGVFLCAIAIVRVKQHVDAPHQHTLSRPMLMFAAAGFLFLLGSTAGTVIQTLGLGGADTYNTGGGLVVNNDPQGNPVANPSLDQMLANFVSDVYGPMISCANVVAYALGLILLAQALLSLAHWGSDPRAHSSKNIAAKMVIGGVLMALPEAVGMLSESLFKADNNMDVVNVTLAYNPSSSPQNVNNALQAALEWVQIIGFIGFVRGWLLLRAAVEGIGQASHGTAFTHIIGGALAINIAPTITALQTTFGLNLINT